MPFRKPAVTGPRPDDMPMPARRPSRAKSRYIAACQHLLVSGVVGVIALTSTGVMTLNIVGPDAGHTTIRIEPLGGPSHCSERGDAATLLLRPARAGVDRCEP